MQMSFGDQVIAPGGLLGEPSAWRLNGTQLNEQVQLFRAVQTAWYSRGNASVELAFTVIRSFASAKLATVFACTHQSSLPQQDTLTLTAGDGSDLQPVYLDDAVIQKMQLTLVGQTVSVEYTFCGGAFNLTS